MMRTMPWDSDDDTKRILSSVPVSMSIAIRQEDSKLVREREREEQRRIISCKVCSLVGHKLTTQRGNNICYKEKGEFGDR